MKKLQQTTSKFRQIINVFILVKKKKKNTMTSIVFVHPNNKLAFPPRKP